jgi:fibronectin-binding autotransporter adhesin
MKIACCTVRIGLFAALLLLFLGMSPARAGCTLTSPTSWNIPGNGDWSTAGNWNPAVVPNSSSSNVCITNGTSAVAANLSVNVGSLQLAGGNILTIQQSLGVGGPSIINSGEINVDGTLTLLDNVTLSGGNLIHVTSNADILQVPGGAQTLTNQNNTIQGAGEIGGNGLSLINESGGTLYANVPGGTLLLAGNGTVTNQGLLEATNDGTLWINDNINNTGGNITANGGTVTLNFTTINGGTLNTVLDGVMNAANATLNGVTLSPGSVLNVVTAPVLEGTFTNDGLVGLAGTSLVIGGGGATLTGGGAVVMSGTALFVEAPGAGLTLNNVNNFIQGTGSIGVNGLSLTNQSGGVVDANVSGVGMSLEGGGLISNQGLLEATNGGILGIYDSVNNAGGNITASGGVVGLGVFNPVTINGGTLNTAGSGVMDALNATLNGVTLSSGSTLTVDGPTALQGTFTNHGTVEVPNLILAITGGDVTLTGGGSIVLSGGVFNEQSGGLTLINVNNLIQGNFELGQNGMSLINQGGGVVNANVSTGTVLLDGGGTVTNQGLLEATNGGALGIDDNVNNTGGDITASGGFVLPHGISLGLGGFVGLGVYSPVTIDGGTLNTEGLGVMEAFSATLNGVTLSSGSTLTVVGPTALQGTFTNHGTVEVPDLNLAITGGNVSLTGGGTIVMSDAYFSGQSGGLTLNNVNNLIQGTGELGQNGMSLINLSAGVVNADVSGGTLLLDGGGLVTNHGLLEATNGGILEIIDNLNNAGGTVIADGGLVLDNGATVTNTGTVDIRPSGALNIGAGAYVQTAGETIVDGVLSTLPAVQLEGGVLTGTGTIVGSVDNTGGIVRPGDAPGTLTIDNAYTQGSSGVLMIDLGGTAPGSYSVLDVGGLATLDGVIEFTLVDGFTPQVGDVFSYLLAGSLAGDFTRTEFSNWSCPQDDSCSIGPNGSLDITAQTASAVPEPSTVALLALGFAGLIVLSQRNRRRRWRISIPRYGAMVQYQRARGNCF